MQMIMPHVLIPSGFVVLAGAGARAAQALEGQGHPASQGPNPGRDLVRQLVNVLKVLSGNHQHMAGVIGSCRELPGSHEGHHQLIPVQYLACPIEDMLIKLSGSDAAKRANIGGRRMSHMPGL